MTKKRILTTVATVMAAKTGALQKKDSANLRTQSY